MLSQAEVCMQRIGTLEMMCHSYLPTDVESIKSHLEHIQEVRKSILEALMVALGNGTQLLDVLKDLQIKGTLDSRPGYNHHSVSLGKILYAILTIYTCVVSNYRAIYLYCNLFSFM